MNKAALIESLMSTFVEEVAEHVSSFNRDLLALEGGQGDAAALLQSLFRTAHNMKGASRAVDVTLIETACHNLEDILAGARDGDRALDAQAFKFLFDTADAIQDAGLRLKEKEGLAGVLRQLRGEGLSILLVEHDMDLVMGLVDRVVVMEFGTKLIEGTPEEVQASPAVRAAYLGTEH
jgi:chemotaxis protein histidine kinase CheA